MIAANELRIGNLVTDGVISPIQVVEVAQHGLCGFYIQKELHDNNVVYSFNLGNVEPIPLTEDWLLRMGFEYTEEDNHNYMGLSVLTTTLWADKSDNFNCAYLEIRAKRIVVNYVHQLQNLYFALTGTELTLNK